MTEQELNLLKQIVKNTPQFEALKKFLLNPLEPVNWLDTLPLDQSDEWYGQQSKMRVEAKRALVRGFEDMERLINEDKPKQIINEAR
jgi:hypothetical protein